MKQDKAVAKYLATYSETTAGAGGELLGSFDHALVIPAAGEGPGLDAAVASVPGGSRGATLVVVVVNEREDAGDQVRRANAQAVARLRRHYPGGAAPFGRLVVLEEVLPARQGVGLARKLGCDFVLGVWAAGNLATPWIHMTDADALVGSDYFDVSAGLSGAALVYPFEHVAPAGASLEDETRDSIAGSGAGSGTVARADTAVGSDTAIGGDTAVGSDTAIGSGTAVGVATVPEAMARYEIMLRHYVAGLRAAGSPYAFHSIGSTIAVDAVAYAQVRGVPRLLAAEDFYLLSKLAKVGPVVQVPGSPIRLSARLSGRVPFGTGRALRDSDLGRMRDCYHPEIFALLGELLRELDAVPPRLALRDARLAAAADSIGLGEAYLHAWQREGGARQPDHAADRVRERMREWLDGFRTRKLVHALRDTGLASAPAEVHVPNSAFLESLAPGAGLSEILVALQREDAAQATTKRGRGGPAWSR